jgi:hypothetical protein
MEKITIRDTLFGDHSLDHWANINSNELPWNLFKEVKILIDKGDDEKAIEALNKITRLPDLESRHYLQAYHFLKELSAGPVKDVILFGVVVEVGMDEGLDLVAVYADHSARYYNYSGAGVIWERADHSIDQKIDDILLMGKDILKQIGPWNGMRPAAPANGDARINLLTSNGLHFGQGPVDALFSDPLGSKILYGMLDMMQTLSGKTNKAN